MAVVAVEVVVWWWLCGGGGCGGSCGVVAVVAVVAVVVFIQNCISTLNPRRSLAQKFIIRIIIIIYSQSSHIVC